MRKADNLPPSCAVVTKSTNLNFLEPSGPVMGLLFYNAVRIQNYYRKSGGGSGGGGAGGGGGGGGGSSSSM